MAQSAAASLVLKSSNHVKSKHFNESSSSSAASSMEEWTLFRDLRSGSSSQKMAALLAFIEKTRSTTSGNAFTADQLSSLADCVVDTLTDLSWEVRLQTLTLLTEMVHHLGSAVDSFLYPLVSKMIPLLADDSIAVQRAAINAFHLYLQQTQHFVSVLNDFIDDGVENENIEVAKQVLVALPIILTSEFAHHDYGVLVKILADKLLNFAGNSFHDEVMEKQILINLKQLKELVGKQRFDAYLSHLSSSVRSCYYRLSGTTAVTGSLAGNGGGGGGAASGDVELEFGILSPKIIQQLDDVDYKIRAKSADEMKVIVANLNESQKMALYANLNQFIHFLNKLLDDSNFGISAAALAILSVLVKKYGRTMASCLTNVLALVTKAMCSSLVKTHYMQIVQQVMQTLGPRQVLDELFGTYSTHRSSKVREEILNVAIAALLTFPSSDFDLTSLSKHIVALLVDPKRRVRLAAMECISLLAQAMGHGRLTPLLNAINEVEISFSDSAGSGLMAAVSARLTRRQLPRLGSDGLVEYATPLPTSGRSSTQQGADIDWIMAASNSTNSSNSARSSARSMVSDTIDLDQSVSNTPVPSSRASPVFDSPGRPQIRKFLGSGKSVKRLPWEDGTVTKSVLNDTKEASGRREEEAGAGGSYKEMYLKKTRKKESDQDEWPSHAFPVVMPSHTASNSSSSSLVKRMSSMEYPPPPTNLTSSNRNMWGSDESLNSTPTKSKKKLDPIPIGSGEPSAILTRPTLAGSAKQRRQVPPLTESTSPGGFGHGGEEDTDSAYGLDYDVDDDDDDDDPDMNQSLKFIHSRASDKRSARQSRDNSVKPSRVTSPSEEDLDESGFYSLLSNEHSELRSRGSRKGGEQSKSSSKKKPDALPNSGPTFRANAQSDVEVVGFGFSGDDVKAANPGPFAHVKSRGRLQKGPLVSPLAQASHSHVGADDIESPLHSGDPMNIVGRAFFGDKQPFGSYDGGAQWGGAGDRTAGDPSLRERRSSKPSHDIDGVYGVKMRRDSIGNEGGPSMGADSYGDGSENGGDTTRVARKTKPIVAKPRAPSIKRRQELPVESSPESNSEPTSRQNSGGTSNRFNPQDVTLSPSKNPEADLREAFRLIELDSENHWEKKCEGMRIVRGLAKFHPDTVAPQLHTIIIHLVREVKNLRSQVSRYAVCTFADLSLYMGKSLDPHLDLVCKELLHKTGESNGFIRDEASAALSAMVLGVTPQKALVALIAGGSNHKNVAVRRTCAEYLCQVVERMGPGKALSGVRDTTDRIIPSAAQFASDSSPQTRYYGRKIFFLLMAHEDFERSLQKYLSPATLNDLKKILDTLRSQGLGQLPQETPSARSTGSNQRGSKTRDSVLAPISPNDGGDSPSKGPKKRFPPASDDAEEVKQLCSDLESSDFRTRLRAIDKFQEMTEQNPSIVEENMVKIFDKFMMCLNDSNSKVNLQALVTMHQVTPILAPSFPPPVLTTCIPKVAHNLAASSRDLHDKALDILDTMIEVIEPSMLLQAFAQQTQHAAPKVRPDMTKKLSQLVERTQGKPKQLQLHAVPALIALVDSLSAGGNSAGGINIRPAVQELALTLNEKYDHQLMEVAGSKLQPRSQKVLKELLESK